MAFHIQHHEGVHINMHDTNIADGVEGEEIPRTHWSLCVGLEAAALWSCFFTSPSINRIPYHDYLIMTCSPYSEFSYMYQQYQEWKGDVLE